MKFASVVTLVFTLSAVSPLAQAINCTAPTDRNLTSQADVNKWLVRAPANCDTVVGNLTINNAGINDLSPLAGIVEVTGNLLIRNTTVPDLDALTALQQVGGYLQLRNNDTLTQIDGLTNVSSVGSYLWIREHQNLTNLDGLDSLTSVSSYIRLNNNAALENVDGLSGITSLGNRLQIDANASLQNLDGLANLASLGNRLQINNNDALVNLDGLANLTSVGNRLQITNNDALVNIDGLAQLTNIPGNLNIRNNDDLVNLNGLAAVVNVSGNLRVDNSADLTACTALIPLLDSIDDGPPGPNGGAVDVGGTVRVASNGGASCNSVAGVLASVVPPVFSLVAAPDTISVSGTVTSSTLTYTIGNSGSIVRATGLAFSNTLPAGLVVASPSNASTDCSGGSLTASGTSISYSGGLVPASASCTITVDIAATAGGSFTNTTGNLTFTLGDSGSSSATITVDDTPPVITVLGANPLELTLGDTFVDPGATAIDQPGNVSVPVTSSNDVNTAMIGGYSVLYDAVDAVGNAAVQQTRVVNVVAPILVRSYTGALPSGNTGTLSFTTGDPLCTFDGDPSFTTDATASPPKPGKLTLVDGLVDFAIMNCSPGATVTLTMDYGAALPPGTAYWKVASPEWRQIAASISGSSATFSITDGGVNDDDGTADGRIVDPSGAGSTAGATAIPVNNPLVLLLMVLGLVLLASRADGLRR